MISGNRPLLEVAHIAHRKGRQFLERYRSSLSYQHLKAYRAVERCRTQALGGHRDKCEGCPYEAPMSYNSCRSRCCPKCQAQARRRWLELQQRDLVNTNYFHVIFTLPHELNPLGMTSPRPFLDLLFDASSQALLEVARDPDHLGAEIGFLSILHTWSSNLLVHYHIHAVVPAGGLSADHQRWIPTSHPMFLLPVPVLSVAFREKFLAGLRQLYRRRVLDCRGPAAHFSDRAGFEQLLENWTTSAGTFTPSRPSEDPNVFCATSAVTPTAWPFPTTALPHSTANASAFAGTIMLTAASSA